MSGALNASKKKISDRPMAVARADRHAIAAASAQAARPVGADIIPVTKFQAPSSLTQPLVYKRLYKCTRLVLQGAMVDSRLKYTVCAEFWIKKFCLFFYFIGRVNFSIFRAPSDRHSPAVLLTTTQSTRPWAQQPMLVDERVDDGRLGGSDAGPACLPRALLGRHFV